MLMNPENLLPEIQCGNVVEHRYANVELKEDWAKKNGEKVSALANKPEQPISWLVLGLTNEGKLVGKDEKWARQREEVISQQINDNLDPVQACTGISCQEINRSWLIVISVKNPGEVVYWNKQAFLASGTTARAMQPEEILKLRMSLPGLADFSRQEITSAYDSVLIGQFVHRVASGGHSTEYSKDTDLDSSETLYKLGVVDRQASRILFGDCGYRVVKYDWNGHPIENLNPKGLYRLLTDEFVKEIQEWTSEQLGGAEEPYPHHALREAIANAVAHAAYFENDGEVILELYPNRISIGNLCLRESVYFANRWFSRSHKTVNGLLMEVLRIAGHVDELGRGKNLIFSESIKKGKRPPDVILERAGRYDRWKLLLYGGEANELQLRLFDRIKAIYDDEQKVLIAHALVLWRDKPVTEIGRYIDGDFSRQFAEVLSSLKGPTFYWKAQDKIVLSRWASVLLGEGKDSKVFSPAEEEQLRSFAYDIQMKYHAGYITPKDLRDLAHMGDTPSEKSLSSKLLSKWTSEGSVKRLGKGKFQFVKKIEVPLPDFTEFLKLLETKTN